MTKLIKRISILLLVISLLNLPYRLQAQVSIFEKSNLSQTQVNDLTDEQILAIYHKAIEAGMSEDQIYTTAAQRGMSSVEIYELKQRLSNLIKTGSIDKKSNTSDQDQPRYKPKKDSIPTQINKRDFQIFGSELFTSNSLVFEPNLRIPAPSNYIVGPDDELVISVYGYSEQKYNLRVNELGEIYIPNVGPIVLSGLTLEEAAEKIKSKLASTIYSAIKTGQTKVQVTLGKIRSIRVTIIGQAQKPGTYTVSSLTTLYNILYLCGGPTPMGSYRSIEIVQNRLISSSHKSRISKIV